MGAFLSVLEYGEEAGYEDKVKPLLFFLPHQSKAPPQQAAAGIARELAERTEFRESIRAKDSVQQLLKVWVGDILWVQGVEVIQQLSV